MELVYLWVKDYKNIKKQGFNFSPRFKCSYDEDTNKLTIDEKKDYVSIFPKNINITAIVGENGSGKSNILEFIQNIIGLSSVVKYNDKYKNLLVIDNNNELLIFNDFFEDIETLYSSYKYVAYESFFKNRILLTPTINYSIFLNENNKSELTPFVPNRKFNHDEEKTENLKAIMMNYIFIKENKLSKIFDNFFKPMKIKIYRTRLMSDFVSNDKSTYKYKVLNKHYEEINKNMEQNNIKASVLGMLKISNLPHVAHELFKDSLLVNDDEIYMHETLYEKNIFSYSYPNKATFFDKINKDIYPKLIMEFNINDLTKNEIEYINDTFSNSFFYIEILNQHNISINDLSSGEQHLLYILNRLLDLIIATKTNNFFILMDEIDNTFHPVWQKQIISYLNNFMKVLEGKRFHFIITSHSPFILSDMPKENVIFLKGGKQVKVDINPFGANIHTLLSHCFFMEDGLIGKFAKEKIEDVINYLNSIKSEITTNEDAQRIINIIGEPVIKRQLQKMLDSKRFSKIDLIEKQIKELQEKLQKQKND